MNLKEQLQADVTAAMRTGDTQRRDTLRLLLAAIKQEEVDRGVTLDDAGMQAVLIKQARQRQESIADSERAGREDLAGRERSELVLTESYLPQMMSRAEIEMLARAVIVETGVTDVKGMGQVMSRLMPRLQGRADGRLVSTVVRELLQ